MIEPQDLIKIVENGLTNLANSDKNYIKYEIKKSATTNSLYIYKTLPSNGQLNILRISDHLPSMRKLIRGTSFPRPSNMDNANVSIDFYKPKREPKVDKKTAVTKIRTVDNKFDNYIGVPSSIPQVDPFTVSSYEYFYRNLDQRDEMILWHCIAAWICCLNPNKEFHDPFATDEIKKARVEVKTAEVHVFGDKIEIIENKQYKNMNKNRIRLTESQLHRVIEESVKRVLKEDFDKAAFENACDDLYYGYGFDFWRKQHDYLDPITADKIWHAAYRKMAESDADFIPHSIESYDYMMRKNDERLNVQPDSEGHYPHENMNVFDSDGANALYAQGGGPNGQVNKLKGMKAIKMGGMGLGAARDEWEHNFDTINKSKSAKEAFNQGRIGHTRPLHRKGSLNREL